MRVAAGFLVFVILSVAALALVLAPGPRAPAAEAQVNTNAIEDGRLLYVQSCASCHGNAGEGTTVAPSLAGAGSAGLDFYMRTGRMPAAYPGSPDNTKLPVLSPTQIAAIIDYASSFSDGPQIPTVTTGVDLSHGWELYLNNCSACHGASAQGGSVGPGVFAPSLRGKDPTTIAEAMIVGPGAMPPFAFSQGDSDAIVSYVVSLNTPPATGAFPLAGGGPVVEGALAALLGVAALIVISRWVARRDTLPDEPAERQDAHGEDAEPLNPGSAGS